MSELPPGFVLDEQPAGLPAGFVLDKPSLAEDAAKSVGSGLANATIGTLGMGGDIRELASRGLDLAGAKLGFDPSGIKSAASLASKVIPPLGFLAAAPTSQDIRATVTDPIVSPDYKPQTIAGDYLKTGAEFTPGLLMGGEGGLLRSIARNVVLPAITSETAGQLTKGTEAEPYARVAGALGGSVAGSVMRGPRPSLPNGMELQSTGSNQFKQAENMNLVVSPTFAEKTAADMRSALKGFDPEAQKSVFNAVDRLESLGKPQAPQISPAQRLQAEMNWEALPVTPPPAPVSMNDVELVRKQLSALRKSTDPSIRAAAKTAQEAITNNQMALSPADVLSGDAASYAKTMRSAVGNYAAGKRAQTVQGKIDLAELNANSPVGGLDSGTTGEALQRTMKQLARPINNTNVPVARKLGFNDQEIAAINDAASGSKWSDLANVLDRVHAGPFSAIPAMIARQIGGRSIKQQVLALDLLVRSRSPHALEVAAQLPEAAKQLPSNTQRLLQILATPAVRNQAAQALGQPVSQSNAY